MSLREDMWIIDNVDIVDNAGQVDNGHSSEDVDIMPQLKIGMLVVTGIANSPTDY